MTVSATLAPAITRPIAPAMGARVKCFHGDMGTVVRVSDASGSDSIYLAMDEAHADCHNSYGCYVKRTTSWRMDNAPYYANTVSGYTVRGPLETAASGYLKYCIDLDGLTIATVNYRADSTPVAGSSLGHVDMGAGATPATWRAFVAHVEALSGVRIAQYQSIRDMDALTRFIALFS